MKKLFFIFTLSFFYLATSFAQNIPLNQYYPIDYKDVYFESSRNYLDAQDKDLLFSISQQVIADPNLAINIVGFAERLESRARTKRHATRRALVVYKYLLTLGVPKHQIGYTGEDTPLYSSKTRVGVLKNRKCTVSVLKNKNAQYQYQPVNKIVEKPIQRYTQPKPQPQPYIAEKGSAKPHKTVEPVRRARPTEKAANYDKAILRGRIVNEKSNRPLKSKVNILLADGQTKSVYAQQDGNFEFLHAQAEVISIQVQHEGFLYFHQENIQLDIANPIDLKIKLKPAEVGEKVKIKEIYFIAGSSKLKNKSATSLDQLHSYLIENPNVRIEVGGHINVPFTLPEDLDEDQMDLSLNRAKAVYEYLVEKGVDQSRVSYRGYGNAEMIYPEAITKEEQAMNRRVEFKILSN